MKQWERRKKSFITFSTEGSQPMEMIFPLSDLNFQFVDEFESAVRPPRKMSTEVLASHSKPPSVYSQSSRGSRFLRSMSRSSSRSSLTTRSRSSSRSSSRSRSRMCRRSKSTERGTFIICQIICWNADYKVLCASQRINISQITLNICFLTIEKRYIPFIYWQFVFERWFEWICGKAADQFCVTFFHPQIPQNPRIRRIKMVRRKPKSRESVWKETTSYGVSSKWKTRYFQLTKVQEAYATCVASSSRGQMALPPWWRLTSKSTTPKNTRSIWLWWLRPTLRR